MSKPGFTWEEFTQRAEDAHLGTEHLVEFTSESDRVIKITIPPKFGLIPQVITHAVPNLRGEPGIRHAIEFAHATPLEYLERWIAANDVFGDDVKLTSVVQWADGQVLLELLIESLGRYQQKLTNRMLPAVDELWKWNGSGNQRKDFTPKDEEALLGFIARWLFEDIGPESGVVVNCEVQPKRGSRTDIQVEAVAKAPGSDFERLTVVIEVKGCWHPDVKTGMHTQLVNGYLRDLGLRAGLYVVGWFACDRWKKPINRLPKASIEESRAWLEGELSNYDGKKQPEWVSGLILDCRWHQEAPSKIAASKTKVAK